VKTALGYSFGNGCKIALVSSGPELIRPSEKSERSWLPMAIAAGIVVVALAVLVIVMERHKTTASVAPVSAAADPYAANLPITGVAMSESGNLAGGKVTYLDGHIANKGNRTVTGIAVQVLFRNVAQEVAQNETQQMKFIRTRDPYVDLEPISAAPLKPGDERDFRLIFDAVTPDWDGAYPQTRILHVQNQ
jgi:Protein of unknown function (DUF2393)